MKYQKYYLRIILAIFMGAISQPLISGAFLILNEIYEDSKIKHSLLCFLGIVVLGLLFAFLSHCLKSYVKNEIASDLRIRSLDEIVHRSIGEFRQKPSSDYINDVLKKVDIWRESYLLSKWNIAENAIQIIVIFAIEFYINTYLGIALGIFLVPMILNNILFPKVIQKRYQELLQYDNRLIAQIKEIFEGIESIKYLQCENRFVQKSIHVVRKYKEQVQKLEYLVNCSGGVANIGVTLSQTGSILIGLWLWKEGTIQLGSLITTIQFSMCVNEPVVNYINALVEYRSTKYLNKEFTANLNRIDHREKCALQKINNVSMLELKNISFRYANQNQDILFGLNAVFERGKKYLIIGESGAGKSTIFRLLLGELNGWKGEYFIDTVPIQKVDSVWDHISYVPQKVFLFQDTIKNNIDILERHSFEKVSEVIEKVKLSKLIESKEQGMDSIIDEEEALVSGGERARIGLARALLEEKEIILIDELLANLDSNIAFELEQMILNIQDKIVIHVSHKSSPELKNRYDVIYELKEHKLMKVQ